jgi:hypothetical protein
MLLLVVVYGVVLVAQQAGGRASPAPRPLGAPDTFTLFHPVLHVSGRGQGGHTAETDRTVHGLQFNRQKDGEKVLSPAFPGSLPRHLLDLKPIEIKATEHEDFVDYEVEFAELNDEHQQARSDILYYLGKSHPAEESSAGSINGPRIHPRRVGQPPPPTQLAAEATPAPAESSTQRLPTTQPGAELTNGVTPMTTELTNGVTTTALLEMMEKARKRQRTVTSTPERSRGSSPLSTTGPTVFMSATLYM